MVLVTGATGFVGRHVVRALHATGQGVIRVLVHRPGNESVLEGVPVEIVQGDVRDLTALQAAMQGVDAVVHLVAIIREGRSGVTFEKVNHLGTRNVVEAAREAGVRHLVHMSAIGAREDPRFQYAYSKWQGEQEVVHSGMPYTILRPSIQFTEGDEFFNTLAATVKLLPLVPVVGRGRNRFQPIAVEDVARCVSMIVLQESFYGQVLEVGGPQQFTYNELLTLIETTLGVRRIRFHMPTPVMKVVAGLMELTLPRPPVTREQLRYLDIDNVTEPDSVERQFGFHPRPVKDNIGYIQGLRWRDALAINLGFMPKHIRDH